MDITIRDDTWYVLNMQLTTKNRKDGIIMIFLVLALTKMRDPPAWLHVVNTLEVWEWVSNFIPDFPDVRLLIHAGIE